MVKIRDLNNKQLTDQIMKYEKILNGLLKEREKRIQSETGITEELMTPKEKANGGTQLTQITLSTHPSITLGTQTVHRKPGVSFNPESETADRPTEFGFKVDDDELQRMKEEEDGEYSSEGTATGVNDEVQVTKLLQLSKEQLDDLKTASYQLDKKKKKKSK